jgi:hypothetical protein
MTDEKTYSAAENNTASRDWTGPPFELAGLAEANAALAEKR